MMKIFLGGTCNDSKWRDELIKYCNGLDVEFFNPVVDDWTPECVEEENRQKEICDIKLFVITPEMTGVYSIAEVVDCAHRYGYATIFCFINEDNGKIFTTGQIKSLDNVGKLLKKLGVRTFNYIDAVYDEIYDRLNTNGCGN